MGSRALRVGAAAILCALTLRLLASGFPEKLLSWLTSPDTAAFLNDAAAPVMDGSCGAEDYLILQLRLRKGLSLDAYKKLYGKEFSTAQLAFVQNCVRAGYANFDGRTLALTPAGLIVQNSILAQLL